MKFDVHCASDPHPRCSTYCVIPGNSFWDTGLRELTFLYVGVCDDECTTVSTYSPLELCPAYEAAVFCRKSSIAR